MTGEELVSRMKRLGFGNQGDRSVALDTNQSNLSKYERGVVPVPKRVEAELEVLELRDAVAKLHLQLR